MSGISAFFRDVRVELAKVTWPSRRETVRYTWIVIVMSAVVALFLGLWDVVFKWLLQNVFLV